MAINREVEAKISTEDNVRVSVHDVSVLRDIFPQWNLLSNEEKMGLSRGVEPIHFEEVSNTTCSGLHEYVVDNLDTGQSVNEDASHLAIGDDDTAASSGDTDLGNQVTRISVTSTNDNGSSLDTSTFVDSSTGNGNDFKEVGLVNQSSSSGDILFNHSVISTVSKTDQVVVTVDVTLSFSAS